MTESEHETGKGPLTGHQRSSNWGYLYWKHGECYGEDENIRIHMTYPTFLRHVKDYLRQKGISVPTNAQIINVGFFLSQVACWHTCTDPAVEITKKKTENMP